jgi:hypothetical protein
MAEPDGWGGAGDGLPRCRRCGRGELVPLSDFGPQGGEVRYKAWVCTDPGCGFAVELRRGQLVRHRGVPPEAPGPAPPAGPGTEAGARRRRP